MLNTIKITKLHNVNYGIIYKIKDKYLIIHDYYSGEKIRNGIFFQERFQKKLKMLSGGGIYEYLDNGSNFEKIYNFFQILHNIEEPDSFGILVDIHRNKIIDFNGDTYQEDYFGIYDDDIDGNINNKYISFSYYLGHYLNEHLPPDGLTREWQITYPEFHLLMQMYFGIYDDKEYKKQLEENEKKGKYNEIKERDLFKEYHKKILGEEEKELATEYLKLELMRKDISGAFDEVEIKKLYDDNWDDEKNSKYLKEIQDHFGKEVVIEK